MHPDVCVWRGSPSHTHRHTRIYALRHPRLLIAPALLYAPSTFEHISARRERERENEQGGCGPPLRPTLRCRRIHHDTASAHSPPASPQTSTITTPHATHAKTLGTHTHEIGRRSGGATMTPSRRASPASATTPRCSPAQRRACSPDYASRPPPRFDGLTRACCFLALLAAGVSIVISDSLKPAAVSSSGVNPAVRSGLAAKLRQQ